MCQNLGLVNLGLVCAAKYLADHHIGTSPQHTPLHQLSADSFQVLAQPLIFSTQLCLVLCLLFRSYGVYKARLATWSESRISRDKTAYIGAYVFLSVLASVDSQTREIGISMKSESIAV